MYVPIVCALGSYLTGMNHDASDPVNSDHFRRDPGYDKNMEIVMIRI